MSFPDLHTNSYISATVHHTNPYITLEWPVVTLAVTMRTHPRAIPLAMITMRKKFMGFLFSYMSMGLRLSGCRSPAIKDFLVMSSTVNEYTHEMKVFFWRKKRSCRWNAYVEAHTTEQYCRYGSTKESCNVYTALLKKNCLDLIISQ